MSTQKERCFGSGKDDYEKYHDEEWGIPSHDDYHLFEMLILEGAQAGLSWETILKRREEYRKVFCGFDPVKVAKMTDERLEALLKDSGIIKNRLKVFSARLNAEIFLKIQKEFGSFDHYLWGFVNKTPVVGRYATLKDVPITSKLSDEISKDLKKRGMKFVGSTIIYSYLQAVGVVNDHIKSCWKCP